VIAFDRPAFGLTERPMRETWGDAEDWRTLNPYSNRAQVDLTITLLDQQGVDRAVLVGNSAGGMIAMLTALAHPERVAGLILLDPAVYVSGGTPSWLRPVFNTPQMRHLGPLLARRIRDWGIDFGRSAWHEPSKANAAVWEGYLKPLRVQNWDRALWELTAASRPSGLSERLAEFTMTASCQLSKASAWRRSCLTPSLWSSPTAAIFRTRNAQRRHWRRWKRG
jgi:pimeloyl-ACP methyl ester carboxylesterase